MNAITKIEVPLNEIANLENISDEELARLTGQKGSGDQNMLPKAIINSAHDDADGNILVAGAFGVPVNGRTAYSKTAQFRVYFRGFQYTDYLDKKDDPEGKGKYLNRSIIIPDIFAEAPDELGGMKCGKLTAKQKAQGMTPAQEVIQKRLKCVQLLYGTITFPKGGTYALTPEQAEREEPAEKVEVVEVPCFLKVPQSSFMTVADTIKGFEKAGKAMQKYHISMSLKRAQNGSTVYYLIEPSVDFLKSSPYDIQLLKQFLEQVKHINSKVLEKHVKALRGETTEEDIADANTFDQDMDDEIPF